MFFNRYVQKYKIIIESKKAILHCFLIFLLFVLVKLIYFLENSNSNISKYIVNKNHSLYNIIILFICKYIVNKNHYLYN